MRGDEEWWWHGRDSQGRAWIFPREKGMQTRLGWRNPSGRRLTTERKVRSLWSLEKVDVEDERGFRRAAREGAGSWEVQHLVKSLLNPSCWSKSWPHHLVWNLITWQQLFLPLSMRIISCNQDASGALGSVLRRCEQRGPEPPSVLLWPVCPQQDVPDHCWPGRDTAQDRVQVTAC